MCHLSHRYHAGACLYFTFAFMATSQDPWRPSTKGQAGRPAGFHLAGATLSHHHAVGTEHAQWLEQDIPAPGVAMLEALFAGSARGAA